MSLPNPGMSFTPFDPLTASEMNDLVENIESLADGSGQDAASVVSESLKVTVGARGYRSAALSIASGAARKITLDAELYDYGGDLNTGTGAFVAPVDGLYQVNATVTIADLDAAADQLLIFIYANGAEYNRGRTYIAATNGDPATSISDLIPLEAGQALELYAQHTSATSSEAITVGPTTTFMSVALIGRTD